AGFAPGGSKVCAAVRHARCAGNGIAFEVADEFIVAYNCHCSNCRATTGSVFMPWGEIEQEKIRVIEGSDSLAVIEDTGTDRAVGCKHCWSLVYWTRTAPEGTYVRVPYG